MRSRFITIILATVAFVAMSLAAAFAAEVDWVQPPFDDILKKAQKENKHIFIDFYTTWCGPCKKLEPVVHELATELDSRVKVVRVDVDRAPTTAAKFGVLSVPTLLLVQEGVVKDQVVGLVSKRDLVARIQKVL